MGLSVVMLVAQLLKVAHHFAMGWAHIYGWALTNLTETLKEEWSGLCHVCF